MTIQLIFKAQIMQIRFKLLQDEKKATPQEEHEGEHTDPHTDYYSSDDHSSDSGEESDQLN